RSKAVFGACAIVLSVLRIADCGLRIGSERRQALVVDQRNFPEGHASDFTESAFLVERAGAGGCVVRVEPDGVGGPASRDSPRLVETPRPDAAALPLRIDRHVEE